MSAKRKIQFPGTVYAYAYGTSDTAGVRESNVTYALKKVDFKGYKVCEIDVKTNAAAVYEYICNERQAKAHSS